MRLARLLPRQLFRLLPLALPLLLLAPLLATPAAAQSLVQLSFWDSAPSSAPDRVQVEIGGLVKGEARQVTLDLQLDPGTRASELIELVGKRLERAGFDVLAPTPVQDATGGTRGTLFLEDTLFVRLRAGAGFRASVTTCETAPSLVRVGSPQNDKVDGVLHMRALAHHAARKTTEALEWQVELPGKAHPAQLAVGLHEGALEAGILSERPTAETWKPTRTKDGGKVIGMTLNVESKGDWRLEVDLPVMTSDE